MATASTQRPNLSHALSVTYLVKLTEQELLHLFEKGMTARPDEYEPGIHAFDRAGLETLHAKGEIHDAIYKMYALAFPDRAQI